MSRKMKGVGLDPSPYAVSEDTKARFRHQSLLQDYQDLHKDTEAAKKKLKRMNQKKLTLLAEVQFLRRRYKYLMRNQAPKPPMVPKPSIAPEMERRSVTRDQRYGRKQAALRQKVRDFDLNQKKGNYSGSASVLKSSSHKGKEVVLQNPSPVLDLNRETRVYSGKEAAASNPIPVFDLNQISREEEEFQVSSELTRMDEPKSSIRSGNDEQHLDMKLSAACRNMGNGSSRAGKRKISWQDPVALRV